MSPRKRKGSRLPSLLPDALNPVHQLRLMGRLIRRRHQTPGSAPGTLVPTGPPRAEKVRIDVMEFGGERIREEEVESVTGILPFAESPAVTWINVEGLHEVEPTRALGERLSIHPLVLEDIFSTGQRPKVEEHTDYLYVVIPMLSIDPKSRTVLEEQVSIILGPNYVLTFQEGEPGDVFGPVRERIRSTTSRIRSKGPDYLTYALVDAVVDHYFTVLEVIGDIAEQLELEVMEGAAPDVMYRLHALKREMVMVRRSVWPVREMVNGLLRTESPLITSATKVFLRDVYDHAVRIIDSVEVLRDVVSGMIDLYLSSLTHRTNEVMKTLTVMASIFIPLTFIVGLYGMNFDFMPELRIPWFYPALIGGMAAIAAAMLWHFRRKGWI